MRPTRPPPLFQPSRRPPTGRKADREAPGRPREAVRFMSLYDDVVTQGETNGYLSSHNKVSGGFGVPYHSVEALCVEAPDYGHLTTSEAMSYLVWIASMRDYLATKNTGYGSTGELGKAWSTMEALIPGANSLSASAIQSNYWGDTPSAQYSKEFDTPKEYPQAGDANNVGKDPMAAAYKSKYGSDKGLYLMHWLADVDDWYGYGGRTFSNTELLYGKMTFINTFQRGATESCFETVPHPSVEQLKYGNARGIIGIFSADSQPAAQWRYTNAPDAEGRAIQGVYFAERQNVSGYSELTGKAGKMTDFLRSDMFDKYYKKIGCQSDRDMANDYSSCHYLMSWYTSWGGSIDDGGYGGWRWKIGCSHVHQFYQNPLLAYTAVYDTSGIGSASGKADKFAEDWETSLYRQLEFYQWLQSKEGPFAGGCTNSWKGQYQTYPTGTTTFYDMAYVPHPVYEDPGSNGWIGNQVWSTQRLCELYYYAKNDAKDAKVVSMLESILPSWVDFFLDSVKWDADAEAASKTKGATYAIPSTLVWTGAPETWNGSKPATSSVSCKIDGYTTSDVGVCSSLANALIWYAAAVGTSDSRGKEALETANKLISRMWELNRDDIGVSGLESNGSFKRIFEEEVYIPSTYTGTMPNGDAIKSGIKFKDIRTQYKLDQRYSDLETYYTDNGNTEGFTFYLHRFWHQGDVLMAMGSMATLFPDQKPENGSGPVGDVLWGDANCDGKVNVQDVAMAAKKAINQLTSSQITEQGLKNIDCKADGKINVQDVAIIAKLALNLLSQSDMPM